MSTQAVMTFAQKIAGDAALQNQIKNLTPGDPNGLLKLASELGFDFTAEELNAVAGQADELNDAQLDQVAGGFGDGSVQPILIGLLVPAVQLQMLGRKGGKQPTE